MTISLLKQLEQANQGYSVAFETLIDQLPWNSDGLLPVIAQQHDTLEVLMMAWVNRESLLLTLESGRVCYWSRSRQAFWRKGDTSGHVQHLKHMRLDCDGDTLLCMVDQVGPACHTNRRSCFYLAISNGQVAVDNAVLNNEQPKS